MKIIELFKNNEFGILMESIQVLKRGGIIAAPSDTVYALYGDAASAETVKKIFSLKARDGKKPMPVFINSFKMLDDVAYVRNEKIKKFLETVWPGKITCVLPSRGWMPMELKGGGGLTIGVRMPNYQFINSLIKSFGKPTTGTSANISGRGNYTDIKNVLNDFKNMPLKPDLFVSAGKLPESNVSTVVDLTSDEPKTLRGGTVPEEKIMKIWNTI